MKRATEQGDEADEAFGGMVARMDMPPHARAVAVGRGHRFAAYPRCSADLAKRRWRSARLAASQGRESNADVGATDVSSGAVSALASVAGIPVAGFVYWARQRGMIRSPRVLRGLEFGVAFWIAALATHALCFWFLEEPTWVWARPIVAGLIGAIAGCLTTRAARS
jgi:hypothetical protein